MNNFAQKKCIPCEIGGSPLTQEEAKKMLNEIGGEWELTDNKITKQFVFKDFSQAIEFVNQVAKIAESENHHPDIHVTNWNKVRIDLFTHAVKGLSENDFILAAKIQEIQ